MTDFTNTPIIELAAIVANHLELHGIEVVLVGGLAVELYSKNIYLTKDIDMVNINYQPPQVMHDAMAMLGFTKVGRVYENTSTKITIEFPSAPLTVGEDVIKETTTVTVNGGKIPILHALDIVKDRLAAYFHWQDKPALAQALTVMLCHGINTIDIKSFCENEGAGEEYHFITTLYRIIETSELTTMDSIEDIVLREFIKRL